MERQLRQESRRVWARRAASPSCASTAATTSMRFSQQAMRELRDVPRDFEDDLETSVVILTGSAKAFSAGFDLKDPGRPPARCAVGRRAHPSPAARAQDVQGLAGAWTRSPSPPSKAIASAAARRWSCRSISASAEERAFPHPRGRARHEHELGLDPAHAGADGAGAHQAGGHPGVRPHLRRRGAGLGPGREGRRGRPGAWRPPWNSPSASRASRRSRCA